MTNYNPQTGIPYGYISFNSLTDWMQDEIMNLPNPDLDDALAEYLRGKLRTLGEDFTDDGEDIDDLASDELIDFAESVDWRLTERFFVGVEDMLVGCEGTIDGVKVRVSELGGALNLWVFKSPRTGKYRPCSPCVPGAGNLDDPDPENGITCYDVPKDWRREAEAC